MLAKKETDANLTANTNCKNSWKRRHKAFEDQGPRGGGHWNRNRINHARETVKCKSRDDTNVSQSVWSFFHFAKSREVSRYLATISRWIEIFRRWFTRCERPLSNVSEFSTNGATVDGSQRPGRNDDLSRHLVRSCALRIRDTNEYKVNLSKLYALILPNLFRFLFIYFF